ncbi:MAG: hypothetical protein H7Y27_16925 [Gemmatimonadaceae bacterium]|nr:hypothetical protein [Chitinophagaceae bacterium]
MTEREVFIAWLMLRGYNISEICARMGLGKKIVVAHIRNMQMKHEEKDLAFFIGMMESFADAQNRH